MRTIIPIALLLVACNPVLPGQSPGLKEYARDLREARERLAAGDFPGVIQTLKGWPGRVPGRPEADHFLGLAYYRLGDYPSAIRHLSAASEHEAEGSEARKQTAEILGAAYYFTNQWQQAIPLLEQVIREGRASSDLQYSLAMSYLLSGNPDRARQTFAEVFRVDAHSPQAYILAVDLMRKEGVEAGAEVLLLEARTKWPEFPGLASRLGAVALNEGDPGRAVALFREELKNHPSDPDAWHALGEALISLGESHEAAEALKRGIWLESGAVSSFVLLAQVYMDAGNYGLAEATLEQALMTHPKSYEANFLLGRLYHKTGRTELAKKQLAIADAIPH